MKPTVTVAGALLKIATGIFLIALSFWAAILGAWAIQCIWPSTPFWLVVVLLWLVLRLFDRPRK